MTGMGGQTRPIALATLKDRCWSQSRRSSTIGGLRPTAIAASLERIRALMPRFSRCGEHGPLPRPECSLPSAGGRRPGLAVHWGTLGAYSIGAGSRGRNLQPRPCLDFRDLGRLFGGAYGTPKCVRCHPQVIANALEIVFMPRRRIDWTSGPTRACMRTAAPVLNPG